MCRSMDAWDAKICASPPFIAPVGADVPARVLLRLLDRFRNPEVLYEWSPLLSMASDPSSRSI